MNNNKKKVLPSILSADFSDLKSDIEKVVKAGIDTLHIDVMDGHFVPNITIGPPVLKSIKKRFNNIFYDVHLMIDNPERYIKPFADAGADLLNIHLETGDAVYIDNVLSNIRDFNIKTGLTIKPNTNVTELTPYLDDIDLILIMTVEPGFGGQSFMDNASQKIKILSDLKKSNNYNYIIEVDGGINRNSLDKAITLGTDWFVIGSAIFEKEDITAESHYYIEKTAGDKN